MTPQRSAFLSAVIINGLIPYLLYKILINYMTSVMALTITAFVPLVESIYSFYKRRSTDVYALFVLVGILLGILAVSLGGSEKLILIRESFVTSVVGMIFLVSLLFPKPLIYYFAKNFSPGEPDQHLKLAQPPYLKVFRFVTLVWGLILTGEAMIKVWLVFQVSVPTFLLVSPVLTNGAICLTMIWQFWYFRHKFKRMRDE